MKKQKIEKKQNESNDVLNKNIASKKLKKILILIILLAIIAYILWTIYLLIKQPTDVFVVEKGSIYLEETNVGYIIRKEQVIQGENYKNGMEQIKAEGEKVAKNEPVFRYYTAGEESLKSKISELDIKIQEAMSNENLELTADVKLIENQIDEKVELLRNTTDVTKLTEYKKEIGALVTKKANIAGETSPKGSYLSKLIEERKNYENILNSGAEYVNSPISGIVSYKVDGLESTLKPDNECFSNLSKEYLDGLNLKTGNIVPTSDICGKIIDNTSCYIATISKTSMAKETTAGKNVTIRLQNTIEVPAKIVYIAQEENDESLIILEIKKQVEELINYRKMTFDIIWWSASGLKVPNQAIVNIDGLDYVVKNRAGYLSKILVKIERRGESYSIATSYTNDELKKLGYTSEEIISMKKISLYDEILLNPDMSKVE